MSRNWIIAFLTVALAGFFVPPARAGYYWGGNGMQVVTSGTVANGAIYMQSVSASRRCYGGQYAEAVDA
jgi:hypothetical protein